MITCQPERDLGNSCPKAARICRLMRLRTTAFLLTFWLIEMPNWLGDSMLEGRALAMVDENLSECNALKVKFGVERRNPC
jgi:hypothetical protein